MADDERGHARTLAKLIGGAKPDPREQIARREGWHRGDRSGALRAGVFGVSDGLVSNTSLVMGFAGSGAARTTVLLAGVAGLLAGSFSMAAGEYVSMASQREMYQRELSLEAQELEENPEEERAELVLLYRAKGLNRGKPSCSPTGSWPTARWPWIPWPAKNSAWIRARSGRRRQLPSPACSRSRSGRSWSCCPT